MEPTPYLHDNFNADGTRHSTNDAQQLNTKL
jgi:hypothetical protein